MGKRYLMRLGKSPFEPVSATQTLDRNTIGNNNGNLVFGAAAHKLFSTADTTVDANHYRISGDFADQVNDEYDGFILPLANAFRPSFRDELQRTAEFIERLRIPFLMLSGGAQLPLDGNPERLKSMEPIVKRFARAVLEHSSALSVRGELTAEYLSSLGFSDVTVVGCPSMMTHGPGHRVDVPGDLPPGSPVAYNLQQNLLGGASLVADAEAHFDAFYFPQDRQTLELMLWGTRPYPGVDPVLPFEPTHRQFVERRAEFHLDASTWQSRLREMSFSFGPRIHGNVAAVLAGVPAVLMAHDARTLELAQYHEIPRVRVDGDVPSTVAELFELADFSGFNRGHVERFDRLSDFVHDNGFEHIYDTGQEQARQDYETRLARLELPQPQRAIWSGRTEEVGPLVANLQERHTTALTVSKELRASATKQATREAKLRRDLERLGNRVDQAERRVRALTSAQEQTDRRLQKLLRVPLAVKRAWSNRS